MQDDDIHYLRFLSADNKKRKKSRSVAGPVTATTYSRLEFTAQLDIMADAGDQSSVSNLEMHQTMSINGLISDLNSRLDRVRVIYAARSAGDSSL